MNEAIKVMLDKYELNSTQDSKNALREIIQEIALLGLWRAKFFEHAAFYGGTALRILYGLDRFSEDLDFSLLNKNLKFDIKKYFKAIESELNSFGFSVKVTYKEKSINTNIDSAFIKANTLINMIELKLVESKFKNINSNEIIKIKFELDKNPPLGFYTEVKYVLNPIPFSVRVYKKPFLFSGKIHAVLCRAWKNRVKGRDWYDMLWYVSNNIPLNLNHLNKRMKQTGHVEKKLKEKDVKKLLLEKLDTIDIQKIKKEISVFLKDKSKLNVWNKDFFASVINKIKFN